MKKEIHKSFKKHSFKVSLLLIVITISILFITFNLKKSSSLVLDINKFLSCSNDAYKSLVDNSIGKKSVTVQEPNLLEWKRNTNEPFIAYTEMSNITANNLTSTEIDSALSKIEKQVLQLDFSKDQLNSQTLSQRKLSRYAFSKENTLLLIEVEPDQSSDEKQMMKIHCAVTNSEYDRLYTELLQSQDVRDELKKLYGENGLMNMRFQIWYVYDATDTVSTNIASYDWYSGYGKWFHKNRNEWVAISDNSEFPDCSVVKKYDLKIGKDCTKE